jgi:transcription-repair coupling factor (superfamily II helicase)
MTTDHNTRYDSWGKLPSSLAAFEIVQTARTHRGPLLVILEDGLHSQQCADDIAFFQAGTNAPLPVAVFPDWETLPYDTFSPHQDIISERLRLLTQLPNWQQGILIVSLNTLLQRIAPPSYLLQQGVSFNCGQIINLTELRRQLEAAGYYCVSEVREHGEFAVRGSIIDLYPMGSKLPLRIDLFDDEIESLRTFDPDTQCSADKLTAFELLPAHEYPLDEAGITHFRKAWREQFTGNPLHSSLYEDVSQGIAPAGIEYYLSLFFDETVSLLDYCPENTCLVQWGNMQDKGEHYWQEIQMRYDERNIDITRPLLPPTSVFFQPNEIWQRSKQFKRIKCQNEQTPSLDFNLTTLPDLTINHKAQNPLQNIEQFLSEYQGRVLFCAESAGRQQALMDLFTTHHISVNQINHYKDLTNSTPCITIAPLVEGFAQHDPNIAVIVETQLFSQHVMQRRQRKARVVDTELIVRDLAELKLGAPVVHLEHGIGRYRGLQTIQLNDLANEFLVLEYAEDDKVYVPVTSLHLISRYSGGDQEHAPLHKLGTDKWAREKQKAKAKIVDVAAELLDVHATREARTGYACKAPDADYLNFASRFPFEETPDQAQAFNAVINDMTAPRSMDRLICGDVGFGKTEVAMRAAYLAMNGGKQVAILVPTTLLAEQHFINFKDRFAQTGMNIELLSRFRSAKESEQVIAGISCGQVDCVIGTHKLLQSRIEFKELGLLIIDEEHRFGVRQKERLKALRAEVDILTLTATPIPRTLNMSLSGMREISIIATPPAKRLSVKTFVMERNVGIIREAILREVMRGGQVFFLHNKVESIHRTLDELEKLVPEAKIRIAHGQMRERELEQVMADFYHQRFNVLLCTTIIENGIDIPTANTIIIDKADHFGLAQLHQLRGRVGRSHHQAYAYLMTPHQKAMTKDAKKRLEAIGALEDLGVGFTLATHDLEIRGAGELLGEEQSGHINAIGFTLYMDMLERAVKALKEGKTPQLDVDKSQDFEMDLKIPALIPESYVGDVHIRLTLYKRIAGAEDDNALRELQVEFIDRFGLLPPEVSYLFRSTQLKFKAQALGIKRLEANSGGGRIEFVDNPSVTPEKIISLIQLHPKHYQFDGPQGLRFRYQSDSIDARLDVVGRVLKQLQK